MPKKIGGKVRACACSRCQFGWVQRDSVVGIHVFHLQSKLSHRQLTFCFFVKRKRLVWGVRAAYTDIEAYKIFFSDWPYVDGVVHLSFLFVVVDE